MAPARDVEILRTPVQFEADILKDALDQEGVPYYSRIETPTGMVLTPSEGVVAFGNQAIVIVPAEAEPNARRVLEALPIGANQPALSSDDEAPMPRRQTHPATMALARGLVIAFFAIMAIAVLGLIVVSLL